MIRRECAGGVVFFEDQVFILKNDKDEWVLPKGVIRERQTAREVALTRVKAEAGLDAQIVDEAGETNYEFFSTSRRKPVNNRVKWFVMRADSGRYRIAFELGFRDGDYYPVERAIEMITYSQDKALVSAAQQIYSRHCQAERGGVK